MHMHPRAPARPTPQPLARSLDQHPQPTIRRRQPHVEYHVPIQPQHPNNPAADKLHSLLVCRAVKHNSSVDQHVRV